MNVLEVEGLRKRFGTQEVIKDVSFAVPEHSVYGFIGKNGAGKTTTMKMILGLLQVDGGSIKVCGESVCYGQTATNRFVGYLPDVPEYYSFLNAWEYLELCGTITGMEKQERKNRSQELLTLVGLKEKGKKRIGGYSRGMKQRLGIAQALLHEPKLLICDEPTSALDPVGRIEILDILQQVRAKTTVLFSTHILSDVERICNCVAILDEGIIVRSGELEMLKEQYGMKKSAYEFTTQKKYKEFKEKCEALLIKGLEEEKEPSLEKVFLEVVR